MGLVINHNMMAMTAARNLSSVYSRLATSTQRLSSGLRINSAADDAAGLAIRELMRTDIAVLNQGVRNASDGISMIQTAEGALSVIDEKLTRMKELAEQAATGTYTTVQREIMDSEYQAMAAEIDRIANATDFNGLKLLDGSLSALHDGSGLKIHFGAGNDAAEDYYFVQIGDSRATEATGLQVGGGGVGDLWRAGTAYTDPQSAVISHDTESSYVSFWYNVNGDDTETVAANPSNLVGIYRATSGDSLQDLVNTINQGTAARVELNLASALGVGLTAGSGFTFTVGNTTVGFTENSAGAIVGADVYLNVNSGAAAASAASSAFASVFNSWSSANTFAIAVDLDTVILFAKEAGATGNSLVFSEGTVDNSEIQFRSLDTDTSAFAGTFSMGGQNWVTANYERQFDGYHLTLLGRDRQQEYDIELVDTTAYLSNAGSWADALDTFGSASGLWTEVQDASGKTWAGADILTQSAAQAALAQLDNAILQKDKVRAGLGALQNRLENTITNITIQAENLQAAESRISDVDVATEMTEFTRNNIMAQAATSMLAQANSLAQLALSLLG